MRRRSARIADMLMKRHPEFSREFAILCVKLSFIRDVTDDCLPREAEHKALGIERQTCRRATECADPWKKSPISPAREDQQVRYIGDPCSCKVQIFFEVFSK
jgi:hypothetical protein